MSYSVRSDQLAVQTNRYAGSSVDAVDPTSELNAMPSWAFASVHDMVTPYIDK